MTDKMRGTGSAIDDAAYNAKVRAIIFQEQAKAILRLEQQLAAKDVEIARLEANEIVFEREIASMADSADANKLQLAAKDAKLKVALEALSHIRWIKDCGIDSSEGNHPGDERDAMYKIAVEAIALLEGDQP